MSFSASDFRVETRGGSEHFRLGDCPSWNQPGAPAVPFRTVYLEIPEGESAEDVRVVPAGTVDLGQLPAPAEGFSRPGAPRASWDRTSVFPAVPFEIGSAAWMRGTQLVPVILKPVAWDPLRRRAFLTTEYTIEITTRPAPLPEGVWKAERRGTRADSEWRRTLDRMVLNRPAGSGRIADATLKPLDSGATPFSPRFRPSVDGSPVDYVIITTDDMASTFQILADWKTERGISTVVRTLSWIRATYPNGVDLGETIRKFIADAASRWGTDYVLLGGDSEHIPVRYGSTLYFGGEKIPADMYYQCLDGTWNGDGDAIFGEGYVSSGNTGDGADLMPEVWLGRAPLSDSLAATVFVGKVLSYEKTPPVDGSASRALIMAEVLFPQQYSPGDSIIYDGASIAEQAVARFAPTLNVTRLYENYLPYAALGALPENKVSVVSHVNQGYGMVQHIGHGYINTMAVGENGDALDNSDAAGFLNSSMYSVLYSINCTSAAIDYNSIGEEWLRNPNGGAVANVGSTRYDFPGTGTGYQNEFYRLLFQVGVPSLGEAFGGSKIPFIPNSSQDSENRWTQFSQILLGDPTLRVWSANPVPLVVSHPGSITLGSETVIVNVTSGGSPLDSAVVCLYKPGDDYESGLTDAAGQVVLTFRPDRPGSATLTVTGRNAIPYQAVLPVNAPVGAHLFASSTAIDDATPPAAGNGDGVFDLFESVNLRLTLTNQGTAGAAGITATLTSSDPNLTILDGSATWPDLAPGASAPPTDAFVVRATGTATDRYETSATLNLSAQGYSRSEPVVLLMGAPLLERYNLAVNDTVFGNGNGVIESNESQLLLLRIRNNGRGAVEGLVGKLRPLDLGTTVLDSVSTYGSINADQVGAGDGFVFRYSDPGIAHKMRFVLEVPGRTLMTWDIDVQKPGVPASPSAGGRATSIALKWNPVTDSDMRSYVIFRAPTAGGPYARVSRYTDSKIAYYNDENLPPLTRFYYRVASLDQSGNQSAMSPAFSATTTLPTAPGFPILLTGTTSSSPTFSYFNGDTIPEIVAGSDEIYVISGTGVEFVDGDNDARTYGVYTQSGKANFWSPPSSTDIDRDGVIDVASAGWSNGNLYLYDGHRTPKPGFPVNINIGGAATPRTWSAPTMVDVDGDGVMEIFINSVDHTYAFRADGTELVDGDNNPATVGVFATLGAGSNYSTPIVADLDNDQIPEVVIASRDMKLYVKRLNGTNYPGFPVTFTGDLTATPAIGDLNNDGLKEIVFGTSNNQLHAMNINKTYVTGWPKGVNFNQDLDSSPALGDIDGDGYLDVAVCAGNGTVYIFKGQNGNIFPGFPVVITDPNGVKISIRSSPVIGNVDALPDMEILFGGQDGNVYAYRKDGTPALGFPIKTDNVVEGSPLVWDLDGDGLTEVCVEGFDQRLYMWDTPAVFTPQSCPWPMFAHDSRRSGIYGTPIFLVTGVPDAAPPLPAGYLSQNWPNPFNPATSIQFTVPEGSRPAVVRLEVFDPAGKRVRRLVEGVVEPGPHTVAWDGTNDRGEAVGSGVYFYRVIISGKSLSRKMVLAR